MPDPVPEILHDDDSGVHSIDSLTSGSSSNNTIPSFADQQLAHERGEQASQRADAAADHIAEEAKEFTRHAEQDLADLESRTKKNAQKVEQSAKEKSAKFREQAGETYEDVKKEAKSGAKTIKQEAKDADVWAGKNKGNPVVIGNVVVMTAMAGLLGVGAYRMHQQGTLTWKVAGAWTGVVGLFAVGDYYVSQ